MNDRSKESVSPVNLGVLADIVRQARLIWRLMLDSRVPTWTKLILPASLVYVVSPIDLIPDVIPVLGQLDDLAIIILGAKMFIDLCPPPIVQEHLQALSGESTWRVEPGQGGTYARSARDDVVDASYEVKKD